MPIARVVHAALALLAATALTACSTVHDSTAAVGNAAGSAGSAVVDAASDTGRYVAEGVTSAGGFIIGSGASIGHQAVQQFTTPKQAENDPLVFDGSYKGRAVLVRGGAECPSARRGVVMIGDNRLTYAYTPNQVFVLPVAADGTLHGQAGDTVLDGKIHKARMELTITSPACATDFRGSFTLNHS